LDGGRDSITDPDDEVDSPIFLDGKSIDGFEPRQLFKNGKTLSTTLKGKGFASNDNISVAIRGTLLNLSVTLSSSFVDENSVAVTIPAGIGTDVYDVIVTVNGKTTTIRRGLFVSVQGAEDWWDIDSTENPLAPMEPFASADEAALAWSNYIYSTSLYTRHEYAALIYRTAPGVFRLSTMVNGEPHSVVPGAGRVPSNATLMAGIHTHPNGNEFSPADKNWAVNAALNIYVAAPTTYGGTSEFQLRRYNHSSGDDDRVNEVTLRHLDAIRADLEFTFRPSWDAHFNSKGRCPEGFSCHKISWPTTPWPPN
jgi:hypothetical protein